MDEVCANRTKVDHRNIVSLVSRVRVLEAASRGALADAFLETGMKLKKETFARIHKVVALALAALGLNAEVEYRVVGLGMSVDCRVSIGSAERELLRKAVRLGAKSLPDWM